MIDFEKYMIAEEGLGSILGKLAKTIGITLAIMVGIPVVTIGIAVGADKRRTKRKLNPSAAERQSLENWPGWANAINNELDKIFPEIESICRKNGLLKTFHVGWGKFPIDFYGKWLSYRNNPPEKIEYIIVNGQYTVPLLATNFDYLDPIVWHDDIFDSDEVDKIISKFKKSGLREYIENLKIRLRKYKYFDLVTYYPSIDGKDAFETPEVYISLRFTGMEKEIILPNLPPYRG